MANETPMGLALLLCDTVIQDRQTGKRTLVGLFDRLHSASFPCVHPAMVVFVSLTSGRGKYDCEVVCRHTETSDVAFAAKGHVTLKDPLQVMELTFNIQRVRFEKPGVYWLEFKVDELPVMMRRIHIQEHQPKKPKKSAEGEE